MIYLRVMPLIVRPHMVWLTPVPTFELVGRKSRGSCSMSAFRILSSSVLLGISKATVATVAAVAADDGIEDADDDAADDNDVPQ